MGDHTTLGSQQPPGRVPAADATHGVQPDPSVGRGVGRGTGSGGPRPSQQPGRSAIPEPHTTTTTFASTVDDA
jgi:hypothetical protein